MSRKPDRSDREKQSLSQGNQKSESIKKYILLKKLNNLKSKDPKQYWKLLQNNKQEVINVPLDIFKDHFEKLAVEEELVEGVELPTVADSFGNLDTNALNQPFSETEIRNVVKNLKNNKAAGIDNILNEYIKHSLDLMLPFYLKLFNSSLFNVNV